MSSWLLLILITILTVIFFKKHIRTYYLVFKIPGPGFLSAGKFFSKQKDVYTITQEIINLCPSVFRIFLGPYPHIVTSRPQDVEMIFNKCLEKGLVYDIFRDLMDNSLVIAPTKEWQKNKRLINNSFNKKVVNSFADIFTKQAKSLVSNLDTKYGTNNKDLMTTVWFYTLSASFESLTDVVPDDDVIKECIRWLKRSEEIFLERINTPWFVIRAFWIRSKLYKEMIFLTKRGTKYLQNVIHTAKSNYDNSETEDPLKKLRFLNNLFNGVQNDVISNDIVLRETKLMIAAASETTASVISFVFIALGIYPEIQHMVYKEIISALGDGNELHIDKIKKLQYLERVINETMRMRTGLPIIGRKLDKDIISEPFVFPAGCEVIIPIDHLHKNPEIWKDPLKFDPDRFLPEEVAKRHRCAYIPFSYGLRNCIGLQYAMLSMKCIIAEIVRNFSIKTLHLKEFADVEATFAVLFTPKNYSIEFTRRQ